MWHGDDRLFPPKREWDDDFSKKLGQKYPELPKLEFYSHEAHRLVMISPASSFHWISQALCHLCKRYNITQADLNEAIKELIEKKLPGKKTAYFVDYSNLTFALHDGIRPGQVVQAPLDSDDEAVVHAMIRLFEALIDDL